MTWRDTRQHVFQFEVVLMGLRRYNGQPKSEEDLVESKAITVREVMSPGTIRADDGNLYVLRGIPDVDEEYGNQAAAKAQVETALLNSKLLINVENVRELPDLPGMEVEAFDSSGKPLIPWLAARVAAALANRPMK